MTRLGLGGAVDIRVGDGSVGDPGGAPYDGIVVTAAAPSIPTPLREQLSAAGGRLVIPVGDRFRQELMLVVRDGDAWRESDEGPCIFVPLVGEAGLPRLRAFAGPDARRPRMPATPIPAAGCPHHG